MGHDDREKIAVTLKDLAIVVRGFLAALTPEQRTVFAYAIMQDYCNHCGWSREACSGQCEDDD